MLYLIQKDSNGCNNGPAGIRTQDLTVISRALYRLSHGPPKFSYTLEQEFK